MFQHGYRRFTEDVDLLVTREGLKEIHRELEGLGYRRPFQGSKNLRDTEHGVKIEFPVDGEIPGRRETEAGCLPDAGVGRARNQRHSMHQPSGPDRIEVGFRDDQFRANERSCRRDRIDQGPGPSLGFCRYAESVRAGQV